MLRAAALTSAAASVAAFAPMGTGINRAVQQPEHLPGSMGLQRTAVAPPGGSACRRARWPATRAIGMQEQAVREAAVTNGTSKNGNLLQSTCGSAAVVAAVQFGGAMQAAAEAFGELPEDMVEAAKQGKLTFEPRGITAEDSIVFIIGLVPFVWATNEFWRRIVAGESFGTGSSSVIIDPDAEIEGSRFRGRSVLGKGAMRVAYALFGLVGFTCALVALTVFQELSK